MSNQAINQEVLDELIALPVSMVAGFIQVPRVRNALLKGGDQFTLIDTLNSINDVENNNIQSFVKSKYEIESLRSGLINFIATTFNNQHAGRSSFDKLAWVVSEKRLTTQLELNLRTIRTIEEHKLNADLGDDYQIWLPWLSLGMVNLFRRWRRPRISAMYRALFKLFGNEDFDYPWETKNLSIRHQLPIQVLYRFEPTVKVYEALTILSNWGLTSVNELRCLHPDAIAASKAKNSPIVQLYRILEAEAA